MDRLEYNVLCKGKLFTIPMYTLPVVVALSCEKQIAQCFWQAQLNQYFAHDWGILHHLTNISVNAVHANQIF